MGVVRYIIGRAGTGKSYLVRSEIKKRLQEEKENKLILLVPEQFTLQAERDLIESQQLKGIMRAEVLSFTRLAYRVMSEVGGLTKIHINHLGKNMILRKIIDESQEDLTIYKKTSKQEGFVTKMNEFICELKQYDIQPLDLAMELQKMEETSLLKMKLSDISLIYQRFNAYLQNGYLDSEDHINLLIENMEKAEFLRGAEIWIDGFFYFTPQVSRIIEKLILMADRVNITFTMEWRGQERDKDLFRISWNTYEKIKKLAVKHQLREVITDLDSCNGNPVKKSEEIQHIERELYAYPYKQYTNRVKNLEIFAGANPYSEIENVAAQIVSLVRDHHYRWKDIAVVSGDMDLYSMMIKRVFEEYDIPYFMDEKRTIHNNPIIQFVLAALEAVSRGYQYSDMFRYLKTGFSDLTRQECEVLENYVLQYGIRGNHWLSDFSKSSGEKLDAMNQLREKVIRPLAVFHEKIRGRKKISKITKALFELLQDARLENKLNDWIEELKQQNRFDYVNENTQIWNTVMEIFDQLNEILGDHLVSLKEYISILESGFTACEIGVIPSTIDQVLVGNTDRSRSHDIRALFVIGANDSVIPSSKEDEGILLDHEKEVMGGRGLVLGDNSETKMDQERLSIYSVFAKPRDYLWVSYALADQGGRAQRPSILIDRLKKLFKGIEIQSDIVNTKERQLHLIATDRSTFKYLIENIRRDIDQNPIEDFWWDVYHWYYQNPQWDERRKLIVEGFFHKNQLGYINQHKIRQLYQIPIQASISRLERFANCPFSHFIAYGLKPKEREEYQLTSPDIGKLFHDFLEKLENQIKIENISWRDLDKEQCGRLAEEVIDGIVPHFANGVLLSSHRNRYLIHRLKRMSKRALWTLTNHIKRGIFEPLGHEISFGMDKEIPPIVVELKNGEKVYLEGRIDRVDLLEKNGENYIKIIDYKSGNQNFNINDVFYGFQLQLIVYLDAVLSMQKNLRKDPVYPAGVFYFKIDDPLVKADEVNLEIIEKEINKKLKMKGLVLKDIEIIKAMDQEIQGYSDILPVAVNTDNEIYKNSSVISKEEFDDLILHVRNLIQEISEEIIKGNIKIEPCKNGQQVSCTYCLFKAICQFDSGFEDNQYKFIRNLKVEEVLNRIKGGGREQNAEMDEGAKGSN